MVNFLFFLLIGLYLYAYSFYLSGIVVFIISVEKQNNPASKCHFIPAVFFKKMGQLSDRICLFQHVCQFRPADCLLQ